MTEDFHYRYVCVAENKTNITAWLALLECELQCQCSEEFSIQTNIDNFCPYFKNKIKIDLFFKNSEDALVFKLSDLSDNFLFVE